MPDQLRRLFATAILLHARIGCVTADGREAQAIFESSGAHDPVLHCRPRRWLHVSIRFLSNHGAKGKWQIARLTCLPIGAKVLDAEQLAEPENSMNQDDIHDGAYLSAYRSDKTSYGLKRVPNPRTA